MPDIVLDLSCCNWDPEVSPTWKDSGSYEENCPLLTRASMTCPLVQQWQMAAVTGSHRIWCGRNTFSYTILYKMCILQCCFALFLNYAYMYIIWLCAVTACICLCKLCLPSVVGHRQSLCIQLFGRELMQIVQVWSPHPHCVGLIVLQLSEGL